MNERKSASRREILTLGLKALAVAVPVAAIIASQPKAAEAVVVRYRRRRRWWWY